MSFPSSLCAQNKTAHAQASAVLYLFQNKLRARFNSPTITRTISVRRSLFTLTSFERLFVASAAAAHAEDSQTSTQDRKAKTKSANPEREPAYSDPAGTCLDLRLEPLAAVLGILP
jgi:hypothetical protein